MNLPATFHGLQNVAAGEALARVGKLMPRIVIVGLVAVIAWQLARFTWILVPKRADTAPLAFTAAPIDMPVRAVNAQKIADAHLFGAANAAGSDIDVANAPRTQMTLVLSGTIASSDPAKGFAFIGESAAAAKFLKVGEQVGGAARLHSVYPDRVMLDRGGRLEALLLPRPGSGLVGARPPPAFAANPPSSRFAENVRRIAETNPAAFSEIVRPQPFMAQGVMQGFRVYPGRNRQQFAKLGLQPGDLVKAINGTPLDDPQRSGEIFNTLSASDRAQITIERNGQVQTISLNTSQITLPEVDDTTHQTGMPPQEIPHDSLGAPLQ